MSDEHEHEMLTTVQAAAWISERGYPIAPSSIAVWRHDGRGPRTLRLSTRGGASRLRYRLADLESWWAQAWCAHCQRLTLSSTETK